MVYEELRGIANARLAASNPGQTLRPTELVHEAYLKLVNSAGRTWENRRHFINAAGTAMRSVIVDHARAKQAEKRGGARTRVPLHEALAFEIRDPGAVLSMNEALEAFAVQDPRAAEVVCLRVFLGLPEREIADVLGVTDRTVQRDWKFAKAWLAHHLQSEVMFLDGEPGG